MKFTFIERHLISKISECVRSKQEVLKHYHFYYFEEPIKFKNKVIDRINSSYPYFKDEILPSSFYHLEGSILREIYFKIKHNDFYVYKTAEDGKSYKTRIKKNENKRTQL